MRKSIHYGKSDSTIFTEPLRYLFLIFCLILSGRAYGLSEEQLDYVKESVIELCRGGTMQGDASTYSVEVGATANIIIKKLVEVGLNGRVEISAIEWQGIKAIIPENAESYNRCVDQIFPLYLDQLDSGDPKAGSWELVSYKHRQYINGIHDPAWSGAIELKASDSSMTIDSKGNVVWKLTVYDEYHDNADPFVDVIATSKLHGNILIPDKTAANHKIHFKAAYIDNIPKHWQHNETETILALLGWSSTGREDPYTYTFDKGSMTIDIFNRRSTFIWAKK